MMVGWTGRILRAALAAVVLAGCVDTGPQASGPAAPAVVLGTRSIDPIDPRDDRPTGPLPDFPACEDPPTPTDAVAPNDLVLPEGSILTEVTDLDPITSVSGYVPLTPSQFRRTYQRREDVILIAVEDDTFDVEVTFSAGDLRVYVQALAVCDRGSRFAAVISPDSPADDPN